MATFINRKGRITALIRKVCSDGVKRSFSKTFGTIEEATKWADNWTEIHKKTSDHDVHIKSTRDVLRLQRHPIDHAMCGVYFLFLGRKCVYVGQSKNIFVRVKDHQLPRSGKKEFDSFSYLELPPESLDAVEAYYITVFNPTLNLAINPGIRTSRSPA